MDQVMKSATCKEQRGKEASEKRHVIRWPLVMGFVGLGVVVGVVMAGTVHVLQTAAQLKVWTWVAFVKGLGEQPMMGLSMFFAGVFAAGWVVSQWHRVEKRVMEDPDAEVKRGGAVEGGWQR